MDTAQHPPLVVPEGMEGVRGGPFSEASLSVAAANVRRVAGWHIAPPMRETIYLDHDGSGVVHLPSLHVTEVEGVWDCSGASEWPISGYRWSEKGMLEGSFPEGFRSIKITLTHGYDQCPADLLPILASRAKRRAMQETVGGASVTWGAEGDRAVESTLALYSLGPRP